jgi:YVTN family beta-propeller protein
MGTVSFANGTNTYSVTSGPSQGTVVVNSATGAFTYIPTEAAQLTATGLSTDMFTETATNQSGTTTPDAITVPISGATLVVGKPIPVGLFPEGVAVSPNGADVYVANHLGSASGTSVSSGTVSDIDTATNTVTTINVGTEPVGVAVSANGADVFVTNEDDGTVSVIDTATNQVATIPVGSGNPFTSNGVAVPNPDSPIGVATSSTGAAFVANKGAGSVTVITNNGPANLTAFSGLSADEGEGPQAVAVSPNGQQLYVTINNAINDPSQLDVVNTATGAITNTATVGFSADGVAVSPTGSLAYVANEFGNSIDSADGPVDVGTVSVINTANPNIVADTITVGGTPTAVAFSPDGSLAYVTLAGLAGSTGILAIDNQVDVINTATNKVITTLTVGNVPEGVAVAPNGTAYVTAGGAVSVISLVQNG